MIFICRMVFGDMRTIPSTGTYDQSDVIKRVQDELYEQNMRTFFFMKNLLCTTNKPFALPSEMTCKAPNAMRRTVPQMCRLYNYSLKAHCLGAVDHAVEQFEFIEPSKSVKLMLANLLKLVLGNSNKQQLVFMDCTIETF